MTIEIIKQEPVRMTAGEYHRLRHEYEMAHQFYSGQPPLFEDWVRERRAKLDDFAGLVAKHLEGK
jgi:hypothetical protein